MSQPLSGLIEGLGQVHGDAGVAIAELCYDSRAVQPGSLFVALRGARSDGHRYLSEAVAAGASAVLVETPPEPGLNVPVAVVPDTRAALAEVAARFYEHPARDLVVIGVTGTNGKTSTVRMIEAVLQRAGRPTGSMGTISVRFPGSEELSSLTTPESLDLQRILARMRAAGVACVALEVSSHSLALGRVRTLRFEVAVYTQLTQDHLDFHADLEEYGATKAQLFGAEYLAGTAVLNARDALTPRLAALARDAGRPVLSYARGSEPAVDLWSSEERIDLAGSRFTVSTPAGSCPITLPLPGDFQIENALAAIGTGLALNVPLELIADGLEHCPAVPGRLERVSSSEPAVFVDYAHTPDALDRVLARVRPLVRGRLICVFGCGGDRDKSKRAPMARAACAHADHVVATSDNPRSEPPEAILRDVREGLSGSFEVLVERRDAIRRAVSLAEPADVVVIAGKGHEDYQIVGEERRPFDDRVEARAALEARS